jgi:hypothetical protein
MHYRVKIAGVSSCLALLVAAVASLGQTGTKPAGSASGEQVQTGAFGTFAVPAGFTSKRTGTADSYKGVAKRDTDGFAVDFDIGFGAGAHMNEKLKSGCTYYREHVINGIPARTGIQEVNGVKTIITTIYDMKVSNPYLPANFWATIKTDADMADFFVIVATYKAAVK